MDDPSFDVFVDFELDVKIARVGIVGAKLDWESPQFCTNMVHATPIIVFVHSYAQLYEGNIVQRLHNAVTNCV